MEAGAVKELLWGVDIAGVPVANVVVVVYENMVGSLGASGRGGDINYAVVLSVGVYTRGCCGFSHHVLVPAVLQPCDTVSYFFSFLPFISDLDHTLVLLSHDSVSWHYADDQIIKNRGKEPRLLSSTCSTRPHRV